MTEIHMPVLYDAEQQRKVVERIRGYAGKKRSEVSNPCLTAREAIALADWIEAKTKESFQAGVGDWLVACFGETIASDKQERNHRFLEEAVELAQSCDCTAEEAHQLVDYVFGRPVGEKFQEVGGVMVTLAALCRAHAIDMHTAADTELDSIWTKVEQIREKQKKKPAFGPLPGVYPERETQNG
jgi:NTP pyrophosphatase (non-canonical NTP hydrolase)